MALGGCRTCATSTVCHQPRQAVCETRLPPVQSRQTPYGHTPAVQVGAGPLWGYEGAWETTALATGPTPAAAAQRLFADLSPALRALALARYTLHPRAALEAPMELDTFWEYSWPATVISCTRSVNPPQAHQRPTAARLHAAWHTLETGHDPMLSAPEALTGLLVA